VSPHPKVLPDGEKPERRFGDHDSVGNKLDARGRAPGQPRYGDHDAEATKYGGHEHDPPIILRARKTGNLKPMRFVSLHHHSTYSYLDGYQLPDAHVRRAIELNMGAMALTEHGNIDSHVKFETAARKMEWGGKPIFGCEFYMPTGPNWFQDGDGERNPNARLRRRSEAPPHRPRSDAGGLPQPMSTGHARQPTSTMTRSSLGPTSSCTRRVLSFSRDARARSCSVQVWAARTSSLRRLLTACTSVLTGFPSRVR
jgi:hypothetical protein